MSAAYPLRLCVRAGRRNFSTLRAPARPRASADPSRATATVPTIAGSQRWASSKKGKETGEAKGRDGIQLFDGKQLDHLIDELFEQQGAKARDEPPTAQATSLADSKLTKVSSHFSLADRPPKSVFRGSEGFWNQYEEDPDMLSESTQSDEFKEDDILSGAHGKLEELREMREYARLAIWDMPLLSKFAKPFEPPTQATPLRWRYTSYMGEFHPAEKKVVVEFCPDDFGLTTVQISKLKKLAGARYNPEKDTIKMSCENFEHAAQNKRYLGDLVNKLIAEAKDSTDTFEDIPLDTRHHTFKVKPKFPKEWRMTEERRAKLAQIRQEAYLLDQAKKSEGSLVDGKMMIQKALSPPEAGLAASKETAQLMPAVKARGGGSSRPSLR